MPCLSLSRITLAHEHSGCGGIATGGNPQTPETFSSILPFGVLCHFAHLHVLQFFIFSRPHLTACLSSVVTIYLPTIRWQCCPLSVSYFPLYLVQRLPRQQSQRAPAGAASTQSVFTLHTQPKPVLHGQHLLNRQSNRFSWFEPDNVKLALETHIRPSLRCLLIHHLTTAAQPFADGYYAVWDVPGLVEQVHGKSIPNHHAFNRNKQLVIRSFIITILFILICLRFSALIEPSGWSSKACVACWALCGFRFILAS